MTYLADFHSEAFIAEAYKTIEYAAIARFRCPLNGECNVNSKTVKILCMRGKIRAEISGYNYRTAIILEGPHAGFSTLPNPEGMRTWKIIDTQGVRRVGERWHEVARNRNSAAGHQAAAE
jgi:hypothetical protein